MPVSPVHLTNTKPQPPKLIAIISVAKCQEGCFISFLYLGLFLSGPSAMVLRTRVCACAHARARTQARTHTNIKKLKRSAFHIQASPV